MKNAIFAVSIIALLLVGTTAGFALNEGKKINSNVKYENVIKMRDVPLTLISKFFSKSPTSSNENTKNTKYAPAPMVGGEPDLTVRITGFSNDGATVFFDIENTGSGDAASNSDLSNRTIRIDVSHDQNDGSAGDTSSYVSIKNLNAGGKVSMSFKPNFILPSGDYDVTVFADATDGVFEIREDNNKDADTVTVK